MEPAPARRHRWATPATAAALGIVTVVLLLAGVPLSVAAHQFVGGLGLFPLMAPFAVVGFIVARRQPANPIGWIMLASAATYSLSADAGSYSVVAFRLGHPDLPLARLATALTQCWIALPLALPLPMLLFPDGRVPSRFWRATLWVYVVLCVGFVFGTASKDVAAFTDRVVHVDSSGELVSLSGSSHDSAAWIAAVLFVLFLVIGFSWVIRAVVSYRRAVGERRQQLKWLMCGGAIAIVGFSLALLFGASHNEFLRLLSIGFIGVTALPVSIGVGILKYRLYEIDRVISRTLSYAIVTGLLIGMYVGLVTFSTRALPLSSPIGVAASTLAAVALFTPLRRRVQRTVDRRFNRTRYDAEITVATFSASLRDAIDLNRIERELVGVVQRAIEPSHVSIWLRPEV
ncbi:MAG: hypothetical protein QOD07_2337 [Frankiaceae bacterium]|jgi:hypothetical protein|nr:hypothetical protein [Frankiaceae bacterium]